MKLIRLCCLVVFALSTFSSVSAAQQASPADPALAAKIAQGKKALVDHRYKDAIEVLKGANKPLHDSCGECNFLLAIAYFQLRDSGHAMESCDKAIKSADSNALRALAHNLKGNLILGSAGDDKKKMQSAESEFQEAVQLDPKTPVFHLNLAKAFLRDSQDDSAKKELQICLDCGPDKQMKDEAEKLIADPKRGREEIAPQFELTTMQGQQVSLKDLVGRVVVMDFWATWCPPCRESVPELKGANQKISQRKTGAHQCERGQG